jgi:hypothetical protein
MTIDELLAAAGLTANDEIPIWDAEATGEPTKKVTAQNFASAVKTLASLLGTGEIANNLTTTTTGKVLDASQGKALKNIIEALTPGDIGALPDSAILTTSTSIPIPAPGSSASYSMPGLTSDHELVRWNFSASKENAPPVGLTWTTYNGYFTITNNGGTTSESIRPVFALPSAIAITAR